MSRRTDSRTADAAAAIAAAPVRATFDGDPVEAAPGASVAAALVASGRNAWRETREGAPRGLFCGIGICFDCIVEIDGESGQRACMIPLRDGMDIRCDGGSRAGSGTESSPGSGTDSGTSGCSGTDTDGAGA